MNFWKTGMTGILVGSLLVGCGTEQAEKKEEPKVEAATKIKVEAETIDPKEWKDVSNAEELEYPDFETNAKGWISQTLTDLQSETPDKYFDAGYDESYHEYIMAQSITNVLGTYIQVEGGDLEKDFDNIYTLAEIVQDEHIKRGEHLDVDYLAEKYGENKQEAVKEWKPSTERQAEAFEYLLLLLNDVHIAINEGATGEVAGFSYQADGAKTNELEAFIKGGE
ncbi:hypothetical protein [Mesobacillus maritimus]|uniref:Lipoprotein n=1 Tax=Mesobacillus maritimus TaxID=1643336 RepID=A0ABS7K8T9_9BACI|nr:hypothetical protein [Mesobacillus maritimus]MBY0098681.1 hypothetical protein [Mesobacillus maritimus]